MCCDVGCFRGHVAWPPQLPTYAALRERIYADDRQRRRRWKWRHRRHLARRHRRSDNSLALSVWETSDVLRWWTSPPVAGLWRWWQTGMYRCVQVYCRFVQVCCGIRLLSSTIRTSVQRILTKSHVVPLLLLLVMFCGWGVKAGMV